MDKGSHLTVQERNRAYTVLSAQDPELADKLANLLLDADDPILSLLRSLIEQQTAAIRESSKQTNEELRALRRWISGIFVVVIVAMVLISGVVGLQVKISGMGMGMTTSAAPAAPILALPPESEQPILPEVDTGAGQDRPQPAAAGLVDG